MQKQTIKTNDLNVVAAKIKNAPKMVPLPMLLDKIEQAISDKKATDGDETVEALRMILPDLRKAIAAGIPLVIAHHAVQVGTLIERAKLWPYVERGLKAFEGSDRGGTARKVQAAKTDIELRKIVEKMRLKYPNESERKISRLVAFHLQGSDEQVSAETIRKKIKKFRPTG